jgi:CheY-like chemotaxis protein
MDILLIEDDVNQAIATRLVLEGLGEEFTVTYANSAEQALGMLLRRESGPSGKTVDPSNLDLMFIDIDLPAMSGIELLRRIKSEAACSDIPIVMFSGDHRQATMDESYLEGASGYIRKPSDWREYHDSLAGAVRYFVPSSSPACHPLDCSPSES